MATGAVSPCAAAPGVSMCISIRTMYDHLQDLAQDMTSLTRPASVGASSLARPGQVTLSSQSCSGSSVSDQPSSAVINHGQ